MNHQEKIWSVISHIPKGKVCSYGGVASRAGLPGYARYVGYTLKHLPPKSSLPWYRVINSKGYISFRVGTEKYRIQKSRLEQEGIIFSDAKISLKEYGWI
tara:strand:- start:371 stop:670 length:300 start_codon:yes stop_codon:yes gene_type:complete